MDNDVKGLEALKKKRLSPQNQKDWILSWLKSRDFKVTYDGFLKLGRDEVSEKDIINELYVDQSDEHKKIPKTYIEAFISTLIREKAKEAYESFIKKFYEPPTNEEEALKQFELFNEASFKDENREMNIAVLKHFIWQVKRKMKGLPITHHLMPIIWGKSDSGKSTAIEKFIAPLESLSIPSEMSLFNDHRRWEVFTLYPVIFMDEMVRASKTDHNSMKHVITQDTISFQPKYERKTLKRKNISTLIGTSNNPPESIILDTTSNRRFFFMNSLDLLDWEKINNINYLEMWRAINHEDSSPLAPFSEVVKALQEFDRNRSSIENFIEDYEITPHGEFFCPTNLLIKVLHYYLQENEGQKASFFNVKVLENEMTRLGFMKGRKACDLLVKLPESIDGTTSRSMVVRGKFRGYFLKSEQFQALGMLKWLDPNE